MKIIAFYLPQYHTIPENDLWWGEGFTEWENVKKAKPLFDGHQQPKVPMNEYYYDLLNNNVKKWQVSLARENGVYGFCFYHYWFDGKLLLEKPNLQFLNDQSLNLNFCLSWANEPWTKAWVSKSNEILIDQNYGDELMWKKHFDYLLDFFNDIRYIKNANKPLFIIYRPNQIDRLEEMINFWNDLAIANGFDGIDFAYQQIDLDSSKDSRASLFKYNIEFQPVYGFAKVRKLKERVLNSLKKIDSIISKIFKVELSNIAPKTVRKYNYDEVWYSILNANPTDSKSIPGVFVDWDNSPRRKNKGRVFIGATPEKFEKYLKEQIIRAKEIYKKDMIFLTAWNEWSEGCYLEPDTLYKDLYLKAIKKSLFETNEFPEELR